MNWIIVFIAWTNAGIAVTQPPFDGTHEDCVKMTHALQFEVSVPEQPQTTEQVIHPEIRVRAVCYAGRWLPAVKSPPK
jgi:hypothetical protein